MTWKWFLVVAAIVGFIAASQQLLTWLRRRKVARAEVRVLEIAAAQLDAEDFKKIADAARQDAKDMQRVRQSLLDEVQQRIPLEARRVYLENRLGELAASINRAMGEYESARVEIQAIGQSADPLSQELRRSVQTIVDRDLQRRRRMEGGILGLLGALVLILILPLEPRALVYESFATLYFADRQNIFAVAGILGVLLLVWCVVLWGASSVKAKWNPTRLLRVPRHARWIVPLATLLAASGLAFAVWMTSITSEMRDEYFSGLFDFYPDAAISRTRYFAQGGLILFVLFLGIALTSGWWSGKWPLRRRYTKGKSLPEPSV